MGVTRNITVNVDFGNFTRYADEQFETFDWLHKALNKYGKRAHYVNYNELQDFAYRGRVMEGVYRYLGLPTDDQLIGKFSERVHGSEHRMSPPGKTQRERIVNYDEFRQ